MEQTAKVIDKGHPLSGMICNVGTLRTDGMYPVTVVDEPWHSGYAKDNQLQFVETVEVEPRFYHDLTQLVALTGWDRQGNRTVISLCMEHGIRDTLRAIFAAYPTTEVIDCYDLKLAARARTSYTVESIDPPVDED